MHDVRDIRPVWIVSAATMLILSSKGCLRCQIARTFPLLRPCQSCLETMTPAWQTLHHHSAVYCDIVTTGVAPNHHSAVYCDIVTTDVTPHHHSAVYCDIVTTDVTLHHHSAVHK